MTVHRSTTLLIDSLITARAFQIMYQTLNRTEEAEQAKDRAEELLDMLDEEL